MSLDQKSSIDVESKAGAQHLEKHADAGAQILGDERLHLTDEENKSILRKTDKRILSILVWVYFLQILDKSVLGYGSVFGLQTDAKLVGTQYSLVGSIAAMAQLAWQPFSMWIIVRVPTRILMPVLVLGWGAAQCAMAAATNYHALLATRFFLGLFEAACLPLFSMVTAQWYRRSEQPLRVAAWYGTNGAATILGSAMSYGLGHIRSDVLRSWQIIFLFVGLVTVVTAPFVYWKMENNVATASFLTEEERPKAVERLRANQTGAGTNEFKWSQVREAFFEIKTWLWIAMSLLLNIGASVSNTFGPLILQGLGYDRYLTSLLNMPFGAVQLLVILLSSYCAYKLKIKSIILAAFMLPVVAGLAMLYALGRTKAVQAPLLVAYYFLGCLFAGNPIMVAWIIGTTGGQTKKAVVMSAYQAGSSAGNIIGPLLFNARDKPTYHPGLRAVLGLFIALICVIGLQALNIIRLNKQKEAQRVREGKPAKIVDHSMAEKYHDADEGNSGIGANAFLDLTDGENSEFVYLL